MWFDVGKVINEQLNKIIELEKMRIEKEEKDKFQHTMEEVQNRVDEIDDIDDIDDMEDSGIDYESNRKIQAEVYEEEY